MGEAVALPVADTVAHRDTVAEPLRDALLGAEPVRFPLRVTEGDWDCEREVDTVKVGEALGLPLSEGQEEADDEPVEEGVLDAEAVADALADPVAVPVAEEEPVVDPEAVMVLVGVVVREAVPVALDDVVPHLDTVEEPLRDALLGAEPVRFQLSVTLGDEDCEREVDTVNVGEALGLPLSEEQAEEDAEPVDEGVLEADAVAEELADPVAVPVAEAEPVALPQAVALLDAVVVRDAVPVALEDVVPHLDTVAEALRDLLFGAEPVWFPLFVAVAQGDCVRDGDVVSERDPLGLPLDDAQPVVEAEPEEDGDPVAEAVDEALVDPVPLLVAVLPLLRVGERVPIAVALPVPVGVPLGAALVVAVELVLLEEVPLRVGAEAEAEEVLVIDMGPDVVTLEVAVAEVGALGVADSEAPLLGDAVEVHVCVVVLLPVELDVGENVEAAEALPSGLPVPELLPVAEVVAVKEGGGDTVGELEGEPL